MGADTDLSNDCVAMGGGGKLEIECTSGGGGGGFLILMVLHCEKSWKDNE